VSDTISSARAQGSVGVIKTQFADLPPLRLDCGTTLHPVRIAYETYGTLSPRRDNVVLVCHALSGDAHAAGWSAEEDAPTTIDGMGAEERGMTARGGLGWWDNLIGPHKAFDTNHLFIICSNFIGSCRGSTGPTSIDPATGRQYGSNFPVVTVGDMVRAQRSLLDHLGIETLFAVAGGSLGGMQALEWTVAYPDSVEACILTASTARLGTQGVALNAIARNAIMADPAWQGGHYDGTGRQPTAGIGIARMIGHITYLSAHSLQEKFDRRLQDRDEYSYSLTDADFEVESYLRYQATSFAARFDANCYLYISRALTYFDVAHTHGDGSLRKALQHVRARYLLLSFTSDWIYPPRDSHDLREALEDNGKSVEEHVIEATYGHDSFLLEDHAQTPLISSFLTRVHGQTRDAASPRPRSQRDSTPNYTHPETQ
jgi:homoserine O-acetyltransferase